MSGESVFKVDGAMKIEKEEKHTDNNDIYEDKTNEWKEKRELKSMSTQGVEF